MESGTPDAGDSGTLVVDVSVIVDGRVNAELSAGNLDVSRLVVPEAVVTELEALAAAGRGVGMAGLTELASLQRLAPAEGMEVTIEGARPTGRVLERAESGDLAADVRRLTRGLEAVLLTSDRVQAAACAARGIPHRLMEPIAADPSGLRLLSWFDEETMSVHLRSRTVPRAKKGAPGHMEIVALGSDPLTELDVEEVAREIIETAERHTEGFIESDAGGSTVVQLGQLRIAIARPPFSDALEITAVRPVALTVLDDYSHADLIRERLGERHRGVLVAGSPGAGKSTFVQAAAGFLQTAGWIIKTMERPRDLVLGDDITQYTALEADMANTADVLLLVRPDYTIFDEMRRTPDFEVFADMRLAGVGMVGVVHATQGIDALQRLVGRVELGMIPQIVDTVVYIDDGDVRQIYEVRLTVKAPTGIMDEGLARPVIEVTDHESGLLAFEIYTFAQQVVVMPIDEAVARKPLWDLAAKTLAFELQREVRGPVEVDILADDAAAVFVQERDMRSVIGRGGSTIRRLEGRYGMRMDVRPLHERGADDARGIEVEVDDQAVVLHLERPMWGATVEVTVGGKPVFLGAVSRRGDVSLRRGTEPAESIAAAAAQRRAVRARRV